MLYNLYCSFRQTLRYPNNNSQRLSKPRDSFKTIVISSLRGSTILIPETWGKIQGRPGQGNFSAGDILINSCRALTHHFSETFNKNKQPRYEHRRCTYKRWKEVMVWAIAAFLMYHIQFSSPWTNWSPNDVVKMNRKLIMDS